MNKFERLNPKLVSVIKKFGYLKPTRVQEKAIPLILENYHVLIISATGSGKTEAAFFPIYSKILDNGLEKFERTFVLYITPLRALNRDILRRMEKIAKSLGIKVSIRHGDTPKSERRKLVKNPPHVLITTPETFQFLLVGPRSREILRNIRWVVVDEIHEIISNKRGIALAVALERLAKLCKHRIQRIGLSATIGDIDLAKKFLGGFRHVEVVIEDFIKPMNIAVEYPTITQEDKISSNNYGVKPGFIARLRRIKELISNIRSSVVFTNTRDLAEIVGLKLKAIFNIDVAVHHGSLSREVRVKAEEKLRKGEVKTVIATSSLELGIDIGYIDFVVQYGSPRQAVKLIHRVGRSGHREFEVSKGVVIPAESLDDVLESAVIVRRALRGNLEKPVVFTNSLDVLAHQIVGLVLEYRALSVDEIYSLIKKAYPYKNLKPELLKEVISLLSNMRLVMLSGNIIKRTNKSWKYYYEVSMIPDVKQYVVKNAITGETVGMLDEKFVIINCEPGSRFILSGRTWEVVGLDGAYVYVKPAAENVGILPWWEGEIIPVDFKVSREVGALKRRLADGDYNALLAYPINPNAKKIIIRKINEQKRKTGFVPSDRNIVIESLGKITIIHVHLGNKGNFTLSTVISHMLKNQGFSVDAKNDPYRIFIISDKPLKANIIVKTLKSICSASTAELREILEREIVEDRLYLWFLFNVAKRFGALKRDVSFSEVMRILPAYKDTLIGLEALNEMLLSKADLTPVVNVLNGIRKGKVNIMVYENSEPMPLTLDLFKTQTLYSEIMYKVPSMIEVFKKRILSKKVKLVCIMCGQTYGIVRIENLPRRVTCKKCGSGFLTVLSPSDTDTEYIIKKRIKGVRLSADEKAILKEEVLKADLVLRYGKYAIIALSTYGVGAKTAAKVIGEIIYGEESFFKALLDAELNFLRTRKYWGT